MSRMVGVSIFVWAVAAASAVEAQIEPAPEGEGEERRGIVVLPAVEVEVSPEEERSRSTVVLTNETMQGQHATNLNDYLFAGIPGVSTSRRSNFGFSGPGAGFAIRGLTNNRVAVFVDGVPSQVNNHGHPRTDQYSPDMLSRVEITRGPSAVLHGASAVGGVVEITTRRPAPGVSGFVEGLAGELDTQEGFGDVGYGWEGGDALFSFMGRTTDAQVLGEEYELRNLNAKVNQSVGPEWRVGARFNDTHEPPSDRFGSDPEQVLFRFTQDLRTYVLTLDREAEAGTGVAAVYYNELDTGSFRETELVGRSNQNERLEKEYGIWAKHTWLQEGGNSLTTGANAVRYTDDPQGADEEGEGFVSPFVHAARRLGGGFQVEGGLRFTGSSQFGTDVSPELGLAAEVDPTFSLRARGGKAFRVPRVSEVRAAIVNEDLDPEDFWHAETGFNKRFAERVALDVGGWWMKGDNLIQRVGEGQTSENVNTGEFTHRGLEVSVNVRATDEVALLAGGSLLHVDEDTRFIPQQTLDLGVDVHPGRFRTTLIGRFAGDNSTEELEDYFVADARFSYEVIDGLHALVDVVNITDEEYATITGFDGPIEQVPRTVLGGLRWAWGAR